MSTNHDDSRHADWINGELDRTNTGEQSDELHTWFETHPEEKADFEAMQAIVRTMEAEGFCDAPDGIVERAVATLPLHRYPVEEAAHHVGGGGGDGWFAWLREAFSRPALRFAGAFAIGLVAGAVVWASVTKHSADPPFDYTLDISEISGTMKSVSSAPGYERVGALSVQIDGVEGTFQLHQHESNETLLAEVQLHSDGPIEWELEYDAHTANLEGFRRFSGGRGNLVATDSETRSQTRASNEGDGRYILYFSTPNRLEAPMTVRIFSSDELLYEDIITEAHE